MSNISITVEAGKGVVLETAGKLCDKNIAIKAKYTNFPAEIETESAMTALLETAEIGDIYKYTGESGTYENGALYVVEESV